MAQALLTSRDFTILDEPFLGLDPVGKGFVKKSILSQAKAGRPIVFSSHDLDDVAEICDHIILIKDGTVQYDGPIYKKTEITINLDRKIMIPADQFTDLTVAGNKISILPSSSEEITNLMSKIINSGAMILDIETRERSLMDMFV